MRPAGQDAACQLPISRIVAAGHHNTARVPTDLPTSTHSTSLFVHSVTHELPRTLSRSAVGYRGSIMVTHTGPIHGRCRA